MSKATRYTPKSANASLYKGLLLYILPSPLLVTLVFAIVKGSSSTIISSVIAIALFYLAATLAKRGFKQEHDYHDSTLSKAPTLPYKMTAAIMLALGVAFSSYALTDNDTILSLLLALSTFVGFYLYYGFDPREDKLGDLPIGIDADDLIEITHDARRRIQSLNEIKKELDSYETKEHLQSIIMQTEEIITAIEKDPKDLPRARKFFKIYLARTEDISQEFLTNQKKGNIDAIMIANYNKLLLSVQETIKEQKEKLEDDDILNLDIQIEALTKQINHEGV